MDVTVRQNERGHRHTMVNCPVCGEEKTLRGLYGHCQGKHGLSAAQVREKLAAADQQAETGPLSDPGTAAPVNQAPAAETTDAAAAEAPPRVRRSLFGHLVKALS